MSFCKSCNRVFPNLNVLPSCISRTSQGLGLKSFSFKLRSLCSWTSSTVDEEEVEKLSRTTTDWWDPNGEFAPLHSMNKLRVFLIKKSLHLLCEEQTVPSRPLRGTRILDVGCGGGILSEPLARLGAEVMGVDVSPRNIHSALHHSSCDPLVSGRVQYRCTTVEQLAEEEPESFDCVVASEVIEHVSDKETFISAITKLIKPGGSLVITTINRTACSYAVAVVGAEYILRLLTPGTHDWNKFVTVQELKDLISSRGSRVVDVKGMFYLPVLNQWCWINDTNINYALCAVKSDLTSSDFAETQTESTQTET